MVSARRLRTLSAGLVFAASLSVGAAQAGVITFDDAYGALGQGNEATDYYAVSDGMTISGSYFGLVGGNSNGDPGNWNMDGTNGAVFLGCNLGTSCSPTFAFSSVLDALSMDLGLGHPELEWSADITLEALLNGSVVDTDMVHLVAAGSSGTWLTASVFGAFNAVRVSFSNPAGSLVAFGFGMDNIVYQTTSVPEPGTLALLGLGLAGLAVMRRRRVG